ncbi:hypothetical protein HK102_011258 [Quaeritorhiza haematococci]|nr:hypothetical protein HK102_011258 [Quaeritorhiza haematococci]
MTHRTQTPNPSADMEMEDIQLQYSSHHRHEHHSPTQHPQHPADYDHEIPQPASSGVLGKIANFIRGGHDHAADDSASVYDKDVAEHGRGRGEAAEGVGDESGEGTWIEEEVVVLRRSEGGGTGGGKVKGGKGFIRIEGMEGEVEVPLGGDGGDVVHHHVHHYQKPEDIAPHIRTKAEPETSKENHYGRPIIASIIPSFEEEETEAIAERAREARKSAAEAVGKVWSKVASKPSSVIEKITPIPESISSRARSAASTGRGYVKSHLSSLTSAASQASSAASEAVSSAKEGVASKAASVSDVAKDKAEEATRTVKKATEAGKKSVGEATESVRSAAGKATEEAKRFPGKIREEVGKAREAVKEGAEKVRGGAERVVEGAEHFAGKVVEGAERAAEEGGGLLKEGYEMVKEKIGGLADRIVHYHPHILPQPHEGEEFVPESVTLPGAAPKSKIPHPSQSTSAGKVPSTPSAPSAKEAQQKEFPAIATGVPGVPVVVPAGYRFVPGKLIQGGGEGGWEKMGGVRVTGLYGAVSTAWMLILMRHVWNARTKANVYVGDGTLEYTREALSSRDGSVNVSESVQASVLEGNGHARGPGENGRAFARGELEMRCSELMEAIEARNTFAVTFPFMIGILAFLELNGMTPVQSFKP